MAIYDFSSHEETERKWLRRICSIHPHLQLLDLTPIHARTPHDGRIYSGESDQPLTVEVKIRTNCSTYKGHNTHKVMLEERKRQELLAMPRPFFFACCRQELKVYVWDLLKAKPIEFFWHPTQNSDDPKDGTTKTYNAYLSKTDCVDVYTLKSLSPKWQ